MAARTINGEFVGAVPGSTLYGGAAGYGGAGYQTV